MNALITTSNNETETMSSREVAELYGKPHNDVLKKIRKLENAYVRVFGNEGKISLVEYKDAKGELRPEILLNKSQALFVASRFDAVLHARVQKRWEDLEAEKQLSVPNFADPAEAAIAFAEQYRRAQLAEKTKAEISHRREATAMNTASQYSKQNKKLRKALERHDCKTITELLEDTGISARIANIELESQGYLYTEAVSGKKRKRLTEKGEEIAKEFPSKKFVQIGILPDCEEFVLDLVLGREAA